MLVKKDEEKAQTTDKSSKLVTNGRGSNKNPNPDPVGAVESSSSVSGPQAGA